MWLLALVLLLAPASAPARTPPPVLTVFAASDLAVAFREIVPLFEQQSGARVTLVLGSTGTLAKQIEHGAPADVFFAADRNFVDRLAARNAVLGWTRTLYARGVAALVASRKAGVDVRGMDDLARPEIRRIAIAHPEHAPYGRAAREALMATGLWERLGPRIVYADNVRQALQLVQTGAAEAGIVALAVADVPEVVATPIDPRRHGPLDQMAAVTTQSARPALAQSFIHLVTGPVGRAILRRHGFRMPDDP